MKRSIRILVLLMILLISVSALFAGGRVENKSTIDGRLYFLSKNTVNNKNKAIKLNVAQSVYTASTTGVQQEWDATKPAQGLFRLMDTLYNVNQPSGGLFLKITSYNNWLFINEENPSYTRSYGINSFRYQSSFSDQWYGSGYGEYNKAELSNSSGSSEYYLFSIPLGSKESSNSNPRYMLPGTITDIDFFITLPQYNDYNSLKEGYYYTDIHYEITNSSGTPVNYTEHHAYINGSNKATLDVDGTQELSGDIRIWGYVGSTESVNAAPYVFNISQTDYTYNMNLQQDRCFDVATVEFSLDEVVEADDDPGTDNDLMKYVVYLSPGPSYESTTYTASDYNFKKLDTEGLQPRQDTNTVYYDVFKNESGTVSFDQFEGHPYVYQMIPEFDTKKLSDYQQSGGWFGGQSVTNRSWLKTWRLNQSVYLKVTQHSLGEDHLKGLYTSYLYFTLVVN